MLRKGDYRGSTRPGTISTGIGRRALIALLLALGMGAGYAGEYVVTPNPELATLRITACFDAPVPAAVRGPVGASESVRGIRVDGHDARMDMDGRVVLSGGSRSCIEYAVDLESATPAQRFRDAIRSVTGAVLLEPRAWLWLPDGAADPVNFLHFVLPAGMNVSVPWQPAGAGRYRIATTMQAWPSRVAIGRIDADRIAVPDAELRFALLHGSPPMAPEFAREWVRRGADAVATIYGAFPVPSPQIIVVPIGRGGEAVPWGEVQRGGGAGVHLFVDQTRSATEFAADWVLVHELAHLVHPNLGADSAWLSEGLATYYQYVARVRAGMLDEREAWQKLHDGFERGKAQTRDGVDLIEATRSMREQRMFMRVYWSGTAMAILADLALRDTGSSLDEALRRFRECCLAESREWEATEFLARLDTLTETRIFSDLGGRHLHSARFPDLQSAYATLGLRVVNGRIELDPGTAAAAVRRGIMAPRN